MAPCIYKFTRGGQIVLQKVASLYAFTAAHEHSFSDRPSSNWRLSNFLIDLSAICKVKKLYSILVWAFISFVTSEVQHLPLLFGDWCFFVPFAYFIFAFYWVFHLLILTFDFELCIK